MRKEDRRRKVVDYWEKKRQKTFGKKVNYKKRKKVAENKLRIKGRFVTKDQAIKMLGMTAKQVQKLVKEQNNGFIKKQRKKKKVKRVRNLDAEIKL